MKENPKRMKIITINNIKEFPSPHLQVMGKEEEALAVAKREGAETIYKYQGIKFTTWAIPTKSYLSVY